MGTEGVMERMMGREWVIGREGVVKVVVRVVVAVLLVTGVTGETPAHVQSQYGEQLVRYTFPASFFLTLALPSSPWLFLLLPAFSFLTISSPS